MKFLATKLLAAPESASARIVTDQLFLLNNLTIKIRASSSARILLSLIFPAILALANLVLENVKQGLIASSICANLSLSLRLSLVVFWPWPHFLWAGLRLLPDSSSLVSLMIDRKSVV